MPAGLPHEVIANRGIFYGTYRGAQSMVPPNTSNDWQLAKIC